MIVEEHITIIEKVMLNHQITLEVVYKLMIQIKDRLTKIEERLESLEERINNSGPSV